MVDLVITKANVRASANARRKDGTAGTNITGGQVVYVDAAASNKLKLADANLTDTEAETAGIALHDSSDGLPLKYVQLDEDFTPGATLVPGTTYILSANAGGIAPDADAVAGWRKRILFVAKSTSKANMAMVKGGTV